MSFEVNTGTAAAALDGTEKIPVSQGGLPRVVQTRRFPYYDGTTIRAEYGFRIDTGGVSSSLYLGDPAGLSAFFTYTPGADKIELWSNRGSIKSVTTGVDFLSWSDLTDDLTIKLIANATFRNSGSLRIQDTDASHTLRFAVGSNLTANRTFTLTTGNANRTLDISAGDVTISSFGASLVDDANAAAAQATLGLVPGANVQPYDADLDAVAASGVAGAWTDYTPTIAADSGTFTSVTATGRYMKIGKTVFIRASVQFTNIGTAAGFWSFSLPFASTNLVGGSNREQVLPAFEIASVGYIGAAHIPNNSSEARVGRFDAAGLFAANGYVVAITGLYECA